MRTRILMKNICYAGVLAALLDLDIAKIRELLAETYAKKPALVDSNMKAIELGYNYTRENFQCPLPMHVAPGLLGASKTTGHMLIDGNTAAGLGCVFAGATVGAWYPITPSTSLMDAYKMFADKLRVDPDTASKNFAFIQAEDELAAIGMVLGANWNGARAFTATSGPGLSLMNEFLGLAYYAEVPAVLFDIQRVGPSTGMPTRTQQCDILEGAYASHGDTKHVCLFPRDPEECFYFARDAFDLAERLQTPIMVMSDLDIGMNDWMCPDLKWDDNYVPDRGKVLSKDEIAKLEKFHRYLDVDGDGIPYRTLPGVHPKGAYFTRGSGHTQYGVYTEDSAEYQVVLDRLTRKFTTAKRLVPKPVIEQDAHIDIAVVAYGSSDGAVREALDILADHGVKTNYMRLRSFPFGDEVEKFLEQQKLVFVVEQNRDAQMRSLLTLETRVEKVEAALAAALQRTADLLRVHRQGRAGGDLPEDPQARSYIHHRCGMTFLPKPKVRHPSLPKNSLGLTRRDYEGGLSTLCAGCGHDSHHRRDHRGVLGHRHRAAEHGEAVGDRLFVEDHGVFRERRTWLQFRARPHAVHRHGRECREPQSHVHRRLG